MALRTTADLVEDARDQGRAVLAFNAVTLEHVEAIVTGAERAGRDVIVQVSENAVAFHGGDASPIAAAAVRLADCAGVGVSLHLDHVRSTDLLYRAADAGFSSVMVDAGALPYEENLAATVAAARWAHGQGLWVEAELGHVGGKQGRVRSAHAAGVRTDPWQAAEYVRATEVDALAVAVGSSHAMRERTATLDHDLVRRLRAAVAVPLVLHGSSGVPGAELRAAVTAGMVKVNIGTAVGVAWTDAVRAVLTDPEVADPRVALTHAREAMASVVVGSLDALEDPCPR